MVKKVVEKDPIQIAREIRACLRRKLNGKGLAKEFIQERERFTLKNYCYASSAIFTSIARSWSYKLQVHYRDVLNV